MKEQQDDHEYPACIVAEINNADIPDKGKQEPAPCHSENTVADQTAQHWIAGSAQTFQSPHIDLINRIQEIKWKDAKNCLSAVLGDFGI